MVEPEERPSVAGQRLGAPESLGISTLEPGQRPPTMTPGRQISIRVQMLDDTQEVFEVSQENGEALNAALDCWIETSGSNESNTWKPRKGVMQLLYRIHWGPLSLSLKR